MIDAATERSFRTEIEWLLSNVPAEVMADEQVRVVHYSYMPWHEQSTISFGKVQERRASPADWDYFMAAKSDGSRLAEITSAYDNHRLTYHFQLVAAASALLAIDPLTFPAVASGPGETRRRAFVDEHGYPNHTFVAEVVDPDGSISFNYCEDVLAQRLG